MGVIEEHDDRDVIKASMSLRNAGDGLSKSMSIEPRKLTIGETVQIVIEAQVVGHNYVAAIKSDLQGPLELVAVLRADAALIVESKTVERILVGHRKKLDQAAQIAGQRSIRDEADEFDPDEAEADPEDPED